MKLVIGCCLCGMLLLSGCATPLKIVEVNAPDVNCVFNPSCTIVVTDTTDTIPIPAGGTNFLQSRTFTGETGAAAAGLYGYEYRINLINAMGVVNIPCIRSLAIDFGQIVRTLDYDGDGSPDDVYIVTKGGIGSVGPTSAKVNGGRVIFDFDNPVCVGGSPGSGDSSFFFGLTSPQPPNSVTATVTEVYGAVYSVGARSSAPGAP